MATQAQPAIGERGMKLHMVDPRRLGGAQFDPAGDAVPIALRMVGHAMAVVADFHDHPIVDPDRQPVPARYQAVIDRAAGKAGR